MPEPTPAPSEEAASTLDEVLPKDRVPVVRPDGSLASVRQSKFQLAVDKGYRPQTPDEQGKFYEQLKYGDSPISAGAAGALRGVTLGLSDAVLPNLGIAKRDTLAGLKGANETASTVGEIGGTLASLLIPGAEEFTGPGLVAKLGRATEAGLARAGAGLGERLAVKAATGAVEGGLFGAGNAVSEASLGNTDLTAEQLISHAGIGALLGGGAGGTLGLIGEAAAPVMKSLSKSAQDATSLAKDFANNRTLKAAGGIQSDIAKLTESEREAIPQLLRERGHIKTGGRSTDVLESVRGDLETQSKKLGEEMNLDVLQHGRLTPSTEPEEAVNVLKDELDNNGKLIGRTLKDADKAGAQFDFTQAKDRLQSFHDGLNPAEQDIMESAVKKAQGFLDKTEAKGGGFEAINSLKSTLQKDTNWMADGAAKYGLKRQLVGILRDEIDTQIAPQIGGDAAQAFLKAKSGYGVITDALELAEKGKGGKDIINGMLESAGHSGDTADLFNLLSKAETLGKKGADRIAGNPWLSPGDRLGGGFLGMLKGGPAGLVLGGAGALAGKVARERGASVVANLASHIAESPILASVANHFAAAATAPAAVAALGPYAAGIAASAARSPAHALADHIALSHSDPAYKDAAAMAGFVHENDAETAQSLQKAHALAALGAAKAEQEARVKELVDKAFRGEGRPSHGVLKKQDFGSKQQRKDDRSAHRQHVDDIMKLAADPSALAERVAQNAGHLANHAPGVMASMTGAASRAVQFLASKAKHPPPGGPLAPEWHQSANEIAKFARYTEAVQDPMSVLKHAASGTVAPEHLEAVKAVYPQLYTQFQGAIASKLADKPKGVPYSQRVQLGLVGGIDPDGTVNGASIIHAQKTFAMPSQKDPQNIAGPKPTAGGASKLTIAARSRTSLDSTSNRSE